MTARNLAILVMIFQFVALASCQQPPIASITVTVADPADLTGATSTNANINFTTFTQPKGPNGNDSNLRMTFTNPEGDSMAIVLAPVSGSVPFPAQAYSFDGSSNTFNLSFTVISSNTSVPYDLTSSSNGTITVSKIGFDDAGHLKTIHAHLRMNFDGAQGGTAAGDIAY